VSCPPPPPPLPQVSPLPIHHYAGFAIIVRLSWWDIITAETSFPPPPPALTQEAIHTCDICVVFFLSVLFLQHVHFEDGVVLNSRKVICSVIDVVLSFHGLSMRLS
jgi:hypothetical protein